MIILTDRNERVIKRFGDLVRGMRAKSITLEEKELRDTSLTKEECIEYIHTQLKPAANRILYKEAEPEDVYIKAAEQARAQALQGQITAAGRAPINSGSMGKALWPGIQSWYGETKSG